MSFSQGKKDDAISFFNTLVFVYLYFLLNIFVLHLYIQQLSCYDSATNIKH
jgi:hypothetical protein